MSNTNPPDLPPKKELKKLYTGYIPHFSILLDRLEEHLKVLVKISTTPSYKTRIKTFESYYRKLLKFPQYAENTNFPVLTDLLGIRIICSFLQNLTEVEEILRQYFSIIEVERKGADRTFREFGYESTHILIEIPAEFRVGLTLPKRLILEVQIRTILQDAWAEVEHELVYKSEFSPFDLPLKRKLASINASLSLADIIFQEIRDYQNKLNAELDKRREDFYHKADVFTQSIVLPTVKTDSLSQITDTDINNGDLNRLETIDDLILSAIEAHNKMNFEKATAIYTKILEKTPNDIVMAVVYKHRGMAFFAQGDYQRAYSDFMESIAHNPDNFRIYYYTGIVLSIMGEDAKAIDFFDQSISLNQYQSHVYFRRALAKYRLNRYEAALKDLDISVSRGFSADEEKKLRAAIAKKLDME